MAELFTFEGDGELGVVDPIALETEVAELLAAMSGPDATAVRDAVMRHYGRSSSVAYTGVVLRTAVTMWAQWAVDDATPAAVMITRQNLEAAVYAYRSIQLLS